MYADALSRILILAPPATGDGADRSRDPHPSARQPSPSLSDVRSRPVIGDIAQDTLLAQLGGTEAEARAALHVLYTTLFDRLWRFAYLLLRSRDEAEEVVHDAFLALWERRTTIDIRTDVSVYLHTAVRNRAYKRHRHERVVARTATDAERQATVTRLIGTIASPEDDLSAHELAREFAEVLSTVSDRDRVALILRWEEGRTYEEIGHVLGVSVVTARAIVLRQQRALRPLLERLR